MGVWLSKNHIEIAKKTSKPGSILERYSYKDIDDKFVSDIVSNEKIKWIQIEELLPEEAYGVIDSILERKPELYFRIYGLYDDSKCDISFLERMPHLKKLRIDCHLRSCPDKIDFNILTRLKLKALHLDNRHITGENFKVLKAAVKLYVEFYSMYLYNICVR